MSTIEAIRALQRRVGVVADGTIGPATIAAINAALDRAVAPPVQLGDWRARMQQRLAVAPDGKLGPASYRALFKRLASPVAPDERIAALAAGAARHFPAFGIDQSPQRLAEFMAECAHESGGWRYMEELASGDAYEGRAALGNTQPGDGRRFKGRGIIQLTGRANYTRAAEETGLPLVRQPSLAAEPENAVLVACLYWKWRGLNALADAGKSDEITRKINGGTNGLADRRRLKAQMKGLVV